MEQMKNMVVMMNELKGFMGEGNNEGGNSLMQGLGTLAAVFMQNGGGAGMGMAPETPTYTAEPAGNINMGTTANDQHPYFMHVSYMIQAAQTGVEAATLADQIVNALPDEEALGDLETFISSETLLQDMAEANPQILHYEDYVYTLAEVLDEKIAKKWQELYPNGRPNAEGGEGVTVDNQ
jgi:hypothetical protein